MIYSDEELRRMGDVNGDGIICKKDLEIMQAAFGSTPESPNWNPACDLNGDGKVDMIDISTAARNYGEVSTKYFTKRLTFSVPAPIIFGAILTVLSRWKAF
jgi:Ca2+-binding EF-hand superfamily protein